MRVSNYHKSEVPSQEKGKEKEKKRKGETGEKMGRNKLRLERMETEKGRRVRFSKRKTGLPKKAKELAILCDVDVALVMFSTTGKPSICVGQNKDLSAIVERLSSLSVEEREDRREYTIKTLKKMYSKTDVQVGPETFSLDRGEVKKFLLARLKELKEKRDGKKRVLREWANPENVEDLANLTIMEEHLTGSVGGVKIVKVQIMEQQKVAQLSQVNQGMPDWTASSPGIFL